MKRMVKNGDLIDVEPDGSITVAGKPVGGGGGGSDYTAGSNIQISGAKEISLKRDLTEIDSIRVKSEDDDVGISAEGYGQFIIKTYGSMPLWPVIKLRTNSTTLKDIILIFSHNRSTSQTISFNAEGSNDSTVYAFLTRGSKVPFVPTGDGTYVLKATVSGGAVTYTWVSEA